MDGEIDGAAEQGFVDLLGEQPLAAEIAQRLVADAVARGGDDAEGDGVGGEIMRIGQKRPHVLGLPKGKRASPCADEQRTICQVIDSVNLNLPMRYPYPA